MDVQATKDRVTERIEELRLKAETFPDEQILGMIFEGLSTDGTVFEMSREGESCGSFAFGEHTEKEQ
jgi:hypothetical protein